MKPDENAARTLWTYDDRGYLSTACRYAADGALLECVTLTYDGGGHLQSQSGKEEGAITYAYDEEVRLVGE